MSRQQWCLVAQNSSNNTNRVPNLSWEWLVHTKRRQAIVFIITIFQSHSRHDKVNSMKAKRLLVCLIRLLCFWVSTAALLATSIVDCAPSPVTFNNTTYACRHFIYKRVCSLSRGERQDLARTERANPVRVVKKILMPANDDRDILCVNRKYM
jgi:hypothetical protein